MGVKGKTVAQLGCSKGIELISIKNLGARHCIGFDISDEFLKQAKEIDKLAQTHCEFIQTDIYDIDVRFDNSFDLVYISIGVICWMPDIKKFFSIVSRLLKPQGLVYIVEQHPLLDMLSSGDEDSPVSFDYSYFMTEPVVETQGLDYQTGQGYDSEPNYSFHHKLSDIFNAAIENGLYIDYFEELSEHISGVWYNVEKQGPEIPMSYVLFLQKQ